MSHDQTVSSQTVGTRAPREPSAAPAPSACEAPRTLSPAARRALAEAEARRRARNDAAAPPATEIGGQAGPDPARYGDWEKGGIVSDF